MLARAPNCCLGFDFENYAVGLFVDKLLIACEFVEFLSSRGSERSLEIITILLL